mmetsp:Transcript_25129/g.46609  ORF Transcript_25129/g.46609 Transcript_25129/m.46609 type:complete len:205 (+) Transcript_25129:711-1325(+)
MEGPCHQRRRDQEGVRPGVLRVLPSVVAGADRGAHGERGRGVRQVLRHYEDRGHGGADRRVRLVHVLSAADGVRASVALQLVDGRWLTQSTGVYFDWRARGEEKMIVRRGVWYDGWMCVYGRNGICRTRILFRHGGYSFRPKMQGCDECWSTCESHKSLWSLTFSRRHPSLLAGSLFIVEREQTSSLPLTLIFLLVSITLTNRL